VLPIICYCPSVTRTAALAGVRVVEVGDHPAASFAARLLGDLGADVVRVEPAPAAATTPAGPEARTQDGMRQVLHWGKRSVRPDGGRAGLQRTADVVMVGPADGEPAPHGWTEVQVREHNPRAVLVYVTDFGRNGPYADWRGTDLVVQAMSGMMALSGSAGREPLKHGLSTSTYAAGLNAAYAAVAALLSAERTGHGVVVDVAVRDCLASELVMNNAFHAFAGVVQGRAPRSGDPLDGHPVSGGQGYVSLQTSARQPVARFAGFFDDPRLEDADYATPERRVANSAALTTILVEHLAEEAPRDVFTRGSDEGMVLGFVQTAGDMLTCPHLRHRGALADVAGWRLPAELAVLSRTPSRVRGPAPAPGAHTDEVLAETTRPDPVAAAVRRPPAHGALSGGPLAGLRVLDLSVIFAVPYLGGLLADLGADVVKVEAPHRVDQTRTDWGGYFDNDPGDEPWNRSGTYQVVNRGKRSLALDLSAPAGRDVFRALVAEVDVVIDNFTPRVMRGWGLTPDALAELNPGLVTLSNTGYGQTGPWSAYKAQGTTLEATMGHMAATGYPDGPPSRAGQSVPDFYACWAGLLALLAALRHRARTGEGQHVDVGMYQVGAAMMPEAFVHHQVHGTDVQRVGPRDTGAAYSAVVPARGDDRWLAVTARDEAELARLRSVVGDTGPVDDAVRRWARERDPSAAAAALQEHGVPSGPVLDAGDLAADPQLAARGFYEPVEIPALGAPRRLVGRPYTWTSEGSTVGIAGPAPGFGADTRAVLREVAGLDDAAVDALYDAGVVADRPAAPPPARPLDLELLLAEGTVTRIERPVVAT
jgi:formyl-CoA transferase